MAIEKKDTRTLDELGRIVIPKEIRAKLGWGERDTFLFHCTENNTLTLQLAEKYQNTTQSEISTAG
ncbi:MAG: AbrB/MazE/SpoVT family DNA-binding domain-containing protein [Defluviitaleaceae bacterium]|nr:AbrB/MazE/SpoVT family DNA-binding domain-containing protein [Defluviitaleaceae bacterium]